MAESGYNGWHRPSPCRIRAAVQSDLAALTAIEKASFAIPWSDESLAEELNDPGRALVLVAEAEQGEVVGYVSCRIVLDEGQINNLAVVPGRRRTGVGSALLIAMLTEATQKGVRRFFLEVRPSNTGACRLYERFGFVPVGRRKNYYADNQEDAIIMLKIDDEVSEYVVQNE